MDALKKWMIIRFTPRQTITLSRWMSFHKLFFISSLLLNGQCSIQVHPPNNSDDLCLLFCLILLLCSNTYVNTITARVGCEMSSSSHLTARISLAPVRKFVSAFTIATIMSSTAARPDLPPSGAIFFFYLPSSGTKNVAFYDLVFCIPAFQNQGCTGH